MNNNNNYEDYDDVDSVDHDEVDIFPICSNCKHGFIVLLKGDVYDRCAHCGFLKSEFIKIKAKEKLKMMIHSLRDENPIKTKEISKTLLISLEKKSPTSKRSVGGANYI